MIWSIFSFRSFIVGRDELRVIRLSSKAVGIVTFSRNDSAGMENSGTETFRLTSVVTF